MRKKLKRYVVTVVDVGESCDGHARVLGCFKTKANAKTYVRNDMEDTCDDLAGTGIQVDFDQMEIVNEDEDIVSVWSIDPVNVELTEDEVINIGAERYVEGIQHGIDMTKEEN